MFIVQVQKPENHMVHENIAVFGDLEKAEKSLDITCSHMKLIDSWFVSDDPYIECSKYENGHVYSIEEVPYMDHVDHL